MRLYHLTTAAPCAGTALASGSFSASRKQEIIVASGTHLHLYRRLKSGILHPAISTPVFGVIRSLGTFRLPGTTRDYLAVTSHSGCLTILRADPTRATFIPVANEPFGRTGARRTVPGEYLACDPQGRALMVAAVERQKFVYVLGRDDSNALGLSSPLDAHKSSTATHALVALDVGFDNPVFAAIEQSYEKDAKKCLVYYELDLGLNHVVRKRAAAVAEDAFVMLAVPGDAAGPGGVIVCSGGVVTYRHLDEEDADGNLLPREENVIGEGSEKTTTRPKRIEALLPFRSSDSNPRRRMIVSGTLFKHKDKNRTVFFFMLCNELGDLIRVELLWSPELGATELRLSYFDSLPAPAVDLRILRSGYLFAIVEGGDSLFLKFKRSEVPADDPAGGFSSSRDAIVANGAPETPQNAAFHPRSQLTHLALSETMPSLGPILGIYSGDFTGEGTSQLVLTGGRGAGGAAVRVLRAGLAAEDRMETLVWKMSANGVFGFRERVDDVVHTFLAISFPTKTNILRVENETLTDITATFGFHKDASSLCAEQMGTNSFVQIHPAGVRFIPSGVAANRTDWAPPPGVRVVCGTVNNMQALAALSNGDVEYFEISDRTGALMHVERLENVLVVAGDDEDTTLGAADPEARPSLALPPVPGGRTRAQFFVVADGATNKVRVYKIDKDGTPQRVALHVAPAPVSSVALVDFGDVDRAVMAAASVAKSAAGVQPLPPRLTLFIGTKHGALVRLTVDYTSGALSQKRTTFLGPAPVAVQHVRLNGVPTCLVMATRAWLFFPQGGRIASAPLCTSPFQWAAPFDTAQVPGFVTVAGTKVRMLCLPAIEAIAASAALPAALSPSAVPAVTGLNAGSLLAKSRLQATPRRLVPLFSLPRGGGGLGEAPRPGAVGVDSEALMSKKGGAGTDRTGHDLFLVLEADHRARMSEVDDAMPDGGTVDNNALPPAAALRTAAQANGNSARPGNKVAKRMRAFVADEGIWASQLRLVSVQHVDRIAKATEQGDGAIDIDREPESVSTLDLVHLGSTECALCATASRMMGTGNGKESSTHIVASVCRNLQVNATGRRSSHGSDREGIVENELHVYRVDSKTRKLEFVHRTAIENGEDNSVHAMVGFRDMVLVGCGRTLRLYQVGKKKLLRKGEQRNAVRNKIAALCVVGGDRVFVGDVQESITVYKYSAGTDGVAGRFQILARDTVPRWTTCLCSVDYNTVCMGDKFGNIIVLRVPEDAQQGAEPGGGGALLNVEACMHVGAAVTQMVMAGTVVRYATVHGALGALVALSSQSDAKLTKEVERAVRRDVSLVGYDHTAFRSAVYPVKNIFDGDLCESFLAKGGERQADIGSAVGREPADVIRALLDLRWTAESQ